MLSLITIPTSVIYYIKNIAREKLHINSVIHFYETFKMQPQPVRHLTIVTNFRIACLR